MLLLISVSVLLSGCCAMRGESDSSDVDTFLELACIPADNKREEEEKHDRQTEGANRKAGF